MAKRKKSSWRPTIIRDTREQEGKGWVFNPGPEYAGMITTKMETGDYTIQGYEDILCIERKGCISELAKNINEKRFQAEIERMQAFKYRFLVGEFTWAQVYQFPRYSGIPQSEWKKLRVTGSYIARFLMEMSVKFGIHIHLVGQTHGKTTGRGIFKRVLEACPPTPAMMGLDEEVV